MTKNCQSLYKLVKVNACKCFGEANKTALSAKTLVVMRVKDRWTIFQKFFSKYKRKAKRKIRPKVEPIATPLTWL